MATWIAHLRIAENLLKEFSDLDEAMFAIGSIAPDSGLPDEKWEKFTPPTEVTHFSAPEGNRYILADMDFYRQHLASDATGKDDLLETSFLFGYFSHLLTDNLWYQIVFQPTRERYQEQFAADHSFIWEVKKDWYGLDFEYIRSHPASIYWRVFLNCSYPRNYLAFLLPEGVRQRITYIQEYYQRQDERANDLANSQRVYLTEVEMSAYVEYASRRVSAIFNHLQGKKPVPTIILSALEIRLGEEEMI